MTQNPERNSREMKFGQYIPNTTKMRINSTCETLKIHNNDGFYSEKKTDTHKREIQPYEISTCIIEIYFAT